MIMVNMCLKQPSQNITQIRNSPLPTETMLSTLKPLDSTDYSRLGSEHCVENTFAPVIVFEQEDILYNRWQAGLWQRAVQTSLQERRPLPLERPLAAHIPLHSVSSSQKVNTFGEKGHMHTLYPCTV